LKIKPQMKMATRSAASKTKFGIAKTIILITLLIVLAQILAVSYLSSYDLFNERNKRYHSLIHQTDFVYEDNRVGTNLSAEPFYNHNDNGNVEWKRNIFNYFPEGVKDVTTTLTANNQVKIK